MRFPFASKFVASFVHDKVRLEPNTNYLGCATTRR